MQVDLLLLLLITISCEAQFTRIYLERNVNKRGVNHSERAEFLYWHNYFRRQVESPRASDMIYLLYHKELETAAYDWAAECNFQHGNYNFTRYQLDPAIKIGQNIAVRIGAYSIQNAVFRWFDEYSDYSYKEKSCKPGAKCGHYEQVAGAVVTHIGCAIVYCPTYKNSRIVKGDAYNIVCNYYPSALRANWVWKNDVLVREKISIYEEGEPCTACPDGYKVCEDRLCRSTPTCLTLDNQCKDPSNTTTCLCDASVYPVYHVSGLSPSSEKTTVSASVSTITDLPSIKSTSTVASTITDLPTIKSASTVTDLPIRKSTSTTTDLPIIKSTQVTHTKTSTFETPSSRITARQLPDETEARNWFSGIESTRTKSGTQDRYTSETTDQIAVTRTNDTTKLTDPKNRQQEITGTTFLPGIATIGTSPHNGTIIATTSGGHVDFRDNMTASYPQPFPSEETLNMCFIKMSTRYLTQDDMLPKDPGAIGDELFQGRWRQIQRQPKISLRVMDAVDSRAVPCGLLSVTMLCYHFVVSAIVCLIIQGACGCM